MARFQTTEEMMDYITLDSSGNVVLGKLKVNGTSTLTGAITASGGVTGSAQSVTPNATEVAGNTVLPTTTAVAVDANANDTDDFIVLPALANVPVGHTITVVSNAAGHEVRTPASSNEKINNQDSDGTQEYAIAAGSQVHNFVKISDAIGWMGQGFTAIGAVVTAVVPD